MLVVYFWACVQGVLVVCITMLGKRGIVRVFLGFLTLVLTL